MKYLSSFVTFIVLFVIFFGSFQVYKKIDQHVVQGRQLGDSRKGLGSYTVFLWTPEGKEFQSWDIQCHGFPCKSVVNDLMVLNDRHANPWWEGDIVAPIGWNLEVRKHGKREESRQGGKRETLDGLSESIRSSVPAEDKETQKP